MSTDIDLLRGTASKKSLIFTHVKDLGVNIEMDNDFAAIGKSDILHLIKSLKELIIMLEGE